MQKNILVRSIAALSGIVMLASVAACGDNTATTTDNSSSSDSTSKSTPISGNFSGAGASSQQAAVEAWIAGFQGTNPEAKIAYNPSGSGAGVQTFLTGATAWAGSDKALADDEVEQSKSVCTEGTAFDVPVYISPDRRGFQPQRAFPMPASTSTWTLPPSPRSSTARSPSGTIRPSPIRTRT